MNFGDSVQDASRSGPDDVTVPGAVGGDGYNHQARSLRTQKPLQDIQDLIDKLAAVTQQLRHPGRRSDGAAGSLALGSEVPQQACAVGGAEGSRAE
jgi:hypothetical protein